MPKPIWNNWHINNPTMFDCDYLFPNPEHADPEGHGLIAIGGDLSPRTLLAAYSQGLFPWFNADEPIAWWCPQPRCVIVPQTFQPTKSLLRNMKKQPYHIRIDSAFGEVMRQCAAPRSYSAETWISRDFIDNYSQLHTMGFAHSVEVWQDDQLVGGLYGLSIGRTFFGESMFHRKTDASKMAFYTLMLLCQAENIPFVDCQVTNDHLLSLGAENWQRDDFLTQLAQHIKKTNIAWTNYQNRVFLSKELALHQQLQ